MLSLANVFAAQAESYYQSDDYYTRDQRSSESTYWFGQGATALGLRDEKFEPEVFKNLLHGVAPDGTSLHARAINPNHHRAGTDYTFSAPKSVSIAALVQGDWQVLEAHHQAVVNALSVMEERYVQTRVRTENGRARVGTGNLVAAVFEHQTSREQDPQLHCHCVMINTTQMQDGSWRSQSNEEIIAHQKLLGEIYQNELAFHLRQSGYEIESRSNGQFELKGYSQELLDVFSTRTRQIQDYLEKWEKKLQQEEGQPLHPSQKKQATLDTRKSKRQIEREVLLAGWQEQIERQGLTLPTISNQVQNLSRSSRGYAQIAAQDGIAHAAEREALFRRSKVERFALENYLGRMSFFDLEKEISKTNELIVVDPIKDKFTTQTALWREKETIRLMESGKEKLPAISSAANMERLIRETPALTLGQQGALRLAATTTDQFMAWQGVAGAGKTFCVQLLAELAEENGYKVRGFAPSAEAAYVLQQEAKIQSQTIASHLLSPDSNSTRKELWVVDEAGLLSTKDAHALLQKATAGNIKVLLIGDTRQLSGVEAGNPFKSLQAAGIATARLEESLRQKTPNLKIAIAHIADGEIEAGIRQLQEAGAIREGRTLLDQSRQMTHDYLGLSASERRRTLILASTHLERSILTNALRSALQEEGSLGKDTFTMMSLRPKDLTIAQAKHAHHYGMGDIILPLQDYKRQGLVKNQTYTVVGIDQEANQLKLQDAEGQAFTINPSKCERKGVYSPQYLSLAQGDRLRWTRNDRDAGTRNGQAFTITSLDQRGNATIAYADGKTASVHLEHQQYADHAWVNTIHSSQGKTADRVLALMNGHTSRESFYVGVSRAKHHLTIYTSDVNELIRLAQRSSAKTNASDYIPLFQVVQNYAQTQKDYNQTSDDQSHRRDVGKRVGDRVGERLAAKLDSALRRDRQFTPSLERIEGFTPEHGGAVRPTRSESNADFEAISVAIANAVRDRCKVKQQESELEEMRQQGRSLYEKYAASLFYSDVRMQDEQVATHALEDGYSYEMAWWIVSQGDEAQRLKNEQGRERAIAHLDQVVEAAERSCNQFQIKNDWQHEW